jgi:hypothetical protein
VTWSALCQIRTPASQHEMARCLTQRSKNAAVADEPSAPACAAGFAASAHAAGGPYGVDIASTSTRPMQLVQLQAVR